MSKLLFGSDMFGNAIYMEVEETNWYDDVVKTIELGDEIE